MGCSVMLQVRNVYALRMAGVLLISVATMWLRTGVMPRWLTFVTDAVALVLLVVTTVSLWATLIFPVWVFVVSVLILVQNFRRRADRAGRRGADASARHLLLGFVSPTRRPSPAHGRERDHDDHGHRCEPEPDVRVDADQ